MTSQLAAQEAGRRPLVAVAVAFASFVAVAPLPTGVDAVAVVVALADAVNQAQVSAPVARHKPQ